MDIINNIKTVRKNKGISHEAMAFNLGITQAAYTKLERSETKLTVDMLYKIAEILEVKIEDLLQVEPKSFHQEIHNNKQVTAISHQQVENLYQSNLSTYEKLLTAKDKQIALLKSLLEKN
jgi:transcriptional regulator with XRE-family HTH domain